MYKLLFLLILPLELLGQVYTIDNINSKTVEGGYIIITPSQIVVDSISLPIVDIVEEKDRTVFMLEGCYQNTSFMGAATLFESEFKRGGVYNCVLYIEIRTKRGYLFNRYGLFSHEE